MTEAPHAFLIERNVTPKTGQPVTEKRQSHGMPGVSQWHGEHPSRTGIPLGKLWIFNGLKAVNGTTRPSADEVLPPWRHGSALAIGIPPALLSPGPFGGCHGRMKQIGRVGTSLPVAWPTANSSGDWGRRPAGRSDRPGRRGERAPHRGGHVGIASRNSPNQCDPPKNRKAPGLRPGPSRNRPDRKIRTCSSRPA